MNGSDVVAEPLEVFFYPRGFFLIEAKDEDATVGSFLPLFRVIH